MYSPWSARKVAKNLKEHLIKSFETGNRIFIHALGLWFFISLGLETFSTFGKTGSLNIIFSDV